MKAETIKIKRLIANGKRLACFLEGGGRIHCASGTKPEAFESKFEVEV